MSKPAPPPSPQEVHRKLSIHSTPKQPRVSYNNDEPDGHSTVDLFPKRVPSNAFSLLTSSIFRLRMLTSLSIFFFSHLRCRSWNLTETSGSLGCDFATSHLRHRIRFRFDSVTREPGAHSIDFYQRWCALHSEYFSATSKRDRRGRGVTGERGFGRRSGSR